LGAVGIDVRCREIDKQTCNIRFARTVDILHLDVNWAITMP
jgi:hypothetical protein